MSTIKVNSIKNTSTADGGIVIDGSGHVTVDDLQMPTAGALSNRNLIINGGMSVSQRTTSEAGITANKYSACDRFRFYPISLGTWTVSQETSGFSDTWETGATERFRTYFKALCTTADGSPAAADKLFVLYTVESQDLKRLQYGTPQAKPAVFSFWVKSNKTGNASIDILQYQNSSRQLSTQYTINTADTWEYKTIALPADPAGSFNYDNNGGLQIYFYMNSGSNTTGGSHNSSWQTYNATSSNASNLGVGGGVSDYFAITGVQLEVGSKATAFEHRSYGDELARCQRYYQENQIGAQTNSGTILVTHSLVPEMRATPTQALLVAGSLVNSSIANSFGSATPRNFYFQVTVNDASNGYITGRKYSYTAEL